MVASCCLHADLRQVSPHEEEVNDYFIGDN